MSNLYFNTRRSVFLQDPSLVDLVWYWVVDSVGPPLQRHRVAYYPDYVIPCSYSTSNKPEITLDKVQFGDGYEQVTESGLNPTRRVFDVKFNKKRAAVAVALERFFRGEPEQSSIYDRRPSEWFWWLPPPYFNSGTLPFKVRCEIYQVTPIDYDAVDITATFTESFEPGLPV